MKVATLPKFYLRAVTLNSDDVIDFVSHFTRGLFLCDYGRLAKNESGLNTLSKSLLMVICPPVHSFQKLQDHHHCINILSLRQQNFYIPVMLWIHIQRVAKPTNVHSVHSWFICIFRDELSSWCLCPFYCPPRTQVLCPMDSWVGYARCDLPSPGSGCLAQSKTEIVRPKEMHYEVWSCSSFLLVKLHPANEAS